VAVEGDEVVGLAISNWFVIFCLVFLSGQSILDGEMEDAREEFVTKITTSQNRLQAYIYTLTVDRNASQDILQATNLVIWEKAQEFVPGTNFIAWAFQIARYQVLAHRKKQSRSKLVFSDNFVNELADTFSDDVADDKFQAKQAALAHCLEKVPSAQRHVIHLRYHNGLRMREIAKEVDKTTVAVEKMISRLRFALMRCITARLAREEAR